jgi:hypothetical protein
MAFEDAKRAQLWLRCAMFGPSGSGKTYSALRIAKGMAEKMGIPYAVIDTEARSASKYAGRFSFKVENLQNKTIDGYIAAMRAAYDAGHKVLVIDSLSHAWRELTEEVDRITSANNYKNSLLSWGKAGPKQKRFIEAILNFPGHIIATMRSKTEWVVGEKNGKAVPENIGLAPEQGKDIEYEFDLLLKLDQRHQATVIKDRTGLYQDEVISMPDETFGGNLYDWLVTGAPPDETGKKAAALPELPPAKIPAKPETPAKMAAPPVQASDPKTKGRTVVDAIGAILKTVSESGEGYFNPQEIEEARQLVNSSPAVEAGLKQLKEFKAFLADEIVRRKGQQEAANNVA